MTIDHLDLGGGLGIVYADETAPDLNQYARIVRDTVGDLGCRLSVEPGRFLVGNAGILVCQVIWVKPGETRDFIFTDGAMNDLIRPTLYEAYHAIRPLRPRGRPKRDPPTSSARFAKAAIILARAAICRRSKSATWWR